MANVLLKSLAAVAMAAAVSAVALPATASANGLRFGIYMGDPYRAPTPFLHRGRTRGHHRDWRGRCSVHHARRKARRMGLRHPRVVRLNRLKVVVRGRWHGYRGRIVFANSRHCPVLRTRY